MSNETQIESNTQTLPNEINPNTTDSAKTKVRNLLVILKPTVLNSVVTFLIFIILLALKKKLALTLSISLGVYLLIAFVFQPLYKDKINLKFANFSFNKTKEKASIITSNSQSIVLAIKGKALTGISLLKVEWFTDYVYLSTVWDFLMEEGIIIQDCREGCFLIIRKTAALKRAADLSEKAKKMVKEIEKSILLTKKKFDIEYTRLGLQLVKGQEQLQSIFQLGQFQDKFLISDDNNLTDEDILFLKNGSSF